MRPFEIVESTRLGANEATTLEHALSLEDKTKYGRITSHNKRNIFLRCFKLFDALIDAQRIAAVVDSLEDMYRRKWNNVRTFAFVWDVHNQFLDRIRGIRLVNPRLRSAFLGWFRGLQGWLERQDLIRRDIRITTKALPGAILGMVDQIYQIGQGLREDSFEKRDALNMAWVARKMLEWTENNPDGDGMTEREKLEAIYKGCQDWLRESNMPGREPKVRAVAGAV